MLARILLSLRHFFRNRIMKIDERSSLERALDNGLILGKNVHIMDGCILDPGHCFLITIEDNVTLAPNVHVLAHDASTKRPLNYTRIAPVLIKSNTFIGAGSIVLPGVTIGKNVIIGAGSVVTQSIQDNSLAFGVPARVRGTYQDFVKGKKEEMEHCHLFDSTYCIDVITDEKREEMKSILHRDKVGYIV